ncbi:cbb3-type cytochrome oxidase assembly protein CcoS [Colwellia piezophila]|uniref:cbb3-type cytochrome oxidase assembly protein CcoS n=1 Tax=Colwellia piezophila TaxID=211668 RepID=UPI00037D56AA|nr:cbb3-type cytochrome oxidase assembly protein CcoS [Colwellia piezophila]
MSIIYILIPVAVLLTSLGIYLFFWAVRTEQFDDLEKQGMSILFDDEQNHSADKSEQVTPPKAVQQTGETQNTEQAPKN